MSEIRISDSLQFYFESASNAQAIDALVQKIQTGNDGPTEDMGWHDLGEYHRALLAAYQVRVDLWLFYKELWESIWAPVLATGEFAAFQAWDSHEYGVDLSLSNAWNDCLYRAYRLGNSQLFASVYSDWRHVRISIDYSDADGQDPFLTTVELDSTLWCANVDKDQSRVSKPELAPVRAQTRVDIAKLKAAAQNALNALNRS